MVENVFIIMCWLKKKEINLGILILKKKMVRISFWKLGLKELLLNLKEHILGLEKLLRKHQKESTGFFGFNKTLRYREGIIEEGEAIAVKGLAQWKTLSEPIEGYSYSKLLTLTGDKKHKLIITDVPEATKRERR